MIRGRKGEEGGALAITMMLLLGLAGLGLAFMTASRSETQIAGNDIRSSQSLYASEAGLNEAMARMWDPKAASYVGENMKAPNQGWGCYIVADKGESSQDPDFKATGEDGLDNDIDGLADEGGEVYPEFLSAQSAFDRQIKYPWVKITYSLDKSNNLIRYGDHDNNPTTRPRKNLVEGIPVVLVTSRGERGSARSTLESSTHT